MSIFLTISIQAKIQIRNFLSNHYLLNFEGLEAFILSSNKNLKDTKVQIDQAQENVKKIRDLQRHTGASSKGLEVNRTYETLPKEKCEEYLKEGNNKAIFAKYNGAQDYFKSHGYGFGKTKNYYQKLLTQNNNMPH